MSDEKPMLFKNEISLGNVISLIVIVGSMFGAWLVQDRRITVIETAYASHVVQDARELSAIDAFKERVLDQLDRIEQQILKRR